MLSNVPITLTNFLKARNLQSSQKSQKRIDQWSALLWTLVLGVVMALSIAISLLYLPVVRVLNTEAGNPAGTRQAYYNLVGLFGVVSIFCLYMTAKRAELRKMRQALEREEREKLDMRTRLSELSELFQVSTALNVQFHLAAILEIIVRRVVSAMKAQQASIMIYDPETGILETRASYGLEAEFARSGRKKMGEGIAGWVAAHKEPLQLEGNLRQSPFGQFFKKNRNITSALSLPLVAGGRCVGVLNVNRINNAEKFQDFHTEILVLFAEHVAAVIDRAEILNRLGNRASELEADNRKLTEMNRMKDVFLTTATHELKTPLTSIIGYAEILGDRSITLETEQRNDFISRLHAEANRLLALIEEVLDISRIECGKLVLNRAMMSINSVAASAIETARSVVRKSGATVVTELDETLPNLEIDEVKIRQVIVNLIVNAAKYSPRSGRITVRTGTNGDFAFIEIQDQGPGIHPEDAPHIFELFSQGAHGSERRAGGLGIGLHLVKRLSEMHGGHVTLRSDSKGSSFIVRLPLALAASSETAGQASSETAGEAFGEPSGVTAAA